MVGGAHGRAADLGSIPTNSGRGHQPAAGVKMPAAYVKTIAQKAYVWGWPMVNQFNRRASIVQALIAAGSSSASRTSTRCS